MATYAIGDIQGCYDPLARLLDRLNFDPSEDRLWLCGDLVNRGGQSDKVMQLIYGQRKRVVCVLGNHDLHFMAAAQGMARGRDEELERLCEHPDADAWLDWLHQCPLMHWDKKRSLVLVHAGIAPNWSLEKASTCAGEVEKALRGDKRKKFFANMYGNSPKQWREGLTAAERRRVAINNFTRMRVCNRQGELEFKSKGPPDSAPHGYHAWFELPNPGRKDHLVICGHWSALGFYVGHGIVAMDTGCVWGGPLTAIDLDQPKTPIQVPGLSR